MSPPQGQTFKSTILPSSPWACLEKTVRVVKAEAGVQYIRPNADREMIAKRFIKTSGRPHPLVSGEGYTTYLEQRQKI